MDNTILKRLNEVNDVGRVLKHPNKCLIVLNDETHNSFGYDLCLHNNRPKPCLRFTDSPCKNLVKILKMRELAKMEGLRVLGQSTVSYE